MTGDSHWNFKIQTATIAEALFEAQVCLRITTMLNGRGDYPIKSKWQLRAFAFLNRACDLACVPLEKGCYGWYTRAPRAFGHYDRCLNSYVMIGTLEDLLEDQARSMALGY